MTFTIDTGACVDAAGIVQYEYSVRQGDGKVVTSSRSCTWPRQHGNSKFTVSDSVNVFTGEALTHVAPTQTSCDCATPNTPALAYRYVYSETYPPLLVDSADPLAASSEQLEMEIGRAAWSDDVVEDSVSIGGGSGFAIQGFRYTTQKYELVRRKKWTSAGSLRRYATDVNEDITVTEGYERTQYEEFRQTLTLKLTASAADAKVVNLGLDVTLVSDITKRLTEVWKSARTSTLKRTFLAHRSYIFWQLLDIVEFKRIKEVVIKGPDKQAIVEVRPPHIETSVVSSAIKYFEDDGTNPRANMSGKA
jgi:hypothetical protein